MQQRADLLSQFNALKVKHNVLADTEFDLFGVRFPWGEDKDIFKDMLGIRTASGLYLWPGTTDPGLHATQNKEGGAAHMCLGYHENIWRVGTISPGTAWEHQGLLQSYSWGMSNTPITRPVNIWRDENRDLFYEKGERLQAGYFGINFHRAARQTQTHIGIYSEGCQVTQVFEDYQFVMDKIINSNSYKADPKMMISYLLLSASEFLD